MKRVTATVTTTVTRRHTCVCAMIMRREVIVVVLLAAVAWTGVEAGWPRRATAAADDPRRATGAAADDDRDSKLESAEAPSTKHPDVPEQRALELTGLTHYDVDPVEESRMVLASLALSRTSARVQRAALRAGTRTARAGTDQTQSLNFEFRVHPWNLWMAYPTDATVEIQRLLPPGLTLAKHRIYEDDDEERHYLLYNLFTSQSVVMGMSTRLEIVVIAERDEDGRRCFVILDYLTNSVSSDAGRSFRAPNSPKTARYLTPDRLLRGVVLGQSWQPVFDVTARVALDRPARRPDPRFIVEGNEYIYYGCTAGEAVTKSTPQKETATMVAGAETSRSHRAHVPVHRRDDASCRAVPDELRQDPAEHAEVVELDVAAVYNAVLPELRGGVYGRTVSDGGGGEAVLPTHAFTYVHDQHYSIVGAGVLVAQ